MFLISPNMIKNKLQIQRLLNLVTFVDIFFNNGLEIVMKEMGLEKWQILLEQQKQTLQQVIRGQHIYFQLVIVFCILRQTLIIMEQKSLFLLNDRLLHNNKITFYYNRNSISDSILRSMERFRIQLLLKDNTWSTRYNILKSGRYGKSSTDWTLVSLIVSVENHGIKLIYDQIYTPHADMCISNFAVTLSVY